MPTLDWIGKAAVVNHAQTVPYRLLHCDTNLSAGAPDAGNLLVEGDNLLALKALLPYYAGQVKCIYIDPPYNTGNEKWVYNDAVNSPEMRAWLGQVVGAEAEDLSRHDKWLCMMYPRLALLRQMLRPDGAIFISIDDNEVANLRALMDEIFGARNFIASFVWKSRSSSAMRGTPISSDHEYLVAYCREPESLSLHGLSKGEEDYPLQDSRGRYASTDLTVGMSRAERPGQFYPIKNPRTGKVYQPNPERVWRFWPETMGKIIDDGLVIWPDDSGSPRMNRPRYKTYFDPQSEKPRPISTWIQSATANEPRNRTELEDFDVSSLETGMTQEGGKVLREVLGAGRFAYPKPLSLVRSLVRAATEPDSIVLDAFAGSGTTGHAVLALNRADGGNRRFVLVEMDGKISGTVTGQRLRKVIEGYTPARDGGTPVAGLGGGFRYCRLGEPLLDAEGRIGERVRFADLARHVFFSETGAPLPANGRKPTPLLGLARGTAYYLLFNGILGDRRPDGGNVLTSSVLESLPPHPGPRVIFGEGCRLGEARLRRESVTFKHIPYQLKTT